MPTPFARQDSRGGLWDRIKKAAGGGKNENIDGLKQECLAMEELSRQLFLESVDLHNEQVPRESITRV